MCPPPSSELLVFRFRRFGTELKALPPLLDRYIRPAAPVRRRARGLGCGAAASSIGHVQITTAAGGRSRFSPSKIGRKQTSSQNGQNALKDDVRAPDQKPILTAAGDRARYHVPLGDNVDRDGLKEGWNHDCGAAARAS